MRLIGRTWPLSSILLMAAGAALVFVGLYFIVIRPSLLPEDVRYMALPAAQLDAVAATRSFTLPIDRRA